MNKYDSSKQVVFGRKTLYNGKTYYRGDSVPLIEKASKSFIEKLLRLGTFIYSENLKKQEQSVKPTQEETPSESSTEESTSDQSVAKIVEDTEESFKVEYKGKIFDVSRNQLRDDGTLTKGGLKAYEEAE